MNEGTVLIIGAGGVGSVTAHKCAMNANVFKKIHLASRTIEKPNAIKASVKQRTGVDIVTHAVDADEPKQVIGLIEKVAPEVVINLALPYQDLAIMEACLATGVHYIDTANYQSPRTRRISSISSNGHSTTGTRRRASWRCLALASTRA